MPGQEQYPPISSTATPALRRVEILCSGEWHEHSFYDLRRGDRFRFIDMVPNLTREFVAQSDAQPGRNGIWAVIFSPYQPEED